MPSLGIANTGRNVKNNTMKKNVNILPDAKALNHA